MADFNPGSCPPVYGQNGIHWGYLDGGSPPGTSSALAVVFTCLTTDKMIYSKNMLVDRDEPWYTGTGTPAANTFDLFSTVTHEWGHMTGFAGPFLNGHFDPNDTSICGSPRTNPNYHTMCPFSYDGDTQQRSLGDHDTHTYAEAYSTQGYWLAGSDGGVFAFGAVRFYGSMGGTALNQPVVGISRTASNNGYWLAAKDGGVFSFGDARFWGSTATILLNQPIVGIAGTPSGNGYWLVASDGGVFAFGDARFLGSTGAISLNRPMVGMAPTPSGNGYWLVASDGGIFAFGDAPFWGSAPSLNIAQSITGMSATPTGNGYWLVASEGGIFAFGGAPFQGRASAPPWPATFVGIARTPSGNGYWPAASNGVVKNFGDAAFFGSGLGSLAAPIVGITAKG